MFSKNSKLSCLETLGKTESVRAISEKPAVCSEWKQEKKWNPFNSYKLLTHVQTWKQIRRGDLIPPPVLITVDPTNICNFNCAWCNAQYIRSKSKKSLSGKILSDLVDFLPRWGSDGRREPGVKALCIAGGGEPLMNPSTAAFIEKLVFNGIDVGTVTNGTRIHENYKALSLCTWVGISVDAGCSVTFDRLKGVSPAKHYFDRVINNIAMLTDYSNRAESRLGADNPACGVSYKFLLYKENIDEVYQAAKLAKEIGCKNIHFRPAGTAWDKIGTENQIVFSKDEIRLFNDQIEMALELDDETFGVYGVTHKFNSQFESFNNFLNCYSIFMTAVIMPPDGCHPSGDGFVFGLCCDRRGDAKLELGKDLIDVGDIEKLWGSEAHWEIHDRIRVDKECPRCTYQPHNEIYEQVILNDCMTYNFI